MTTPSTKNASSPNTIIHQRVEAARNGTNPTVICRLPSGWAVLCDAQYLRGYCILLPDPVVESLNALDRSQRAGYLYDMTLIGDALLEVTDALRINYAVLGNSDPALHAHIVPRYATEPEEYRKGPPWSYPRELMNARKFNIEQDKALIRQLAEAIQKRIVKNEP
jgi:diadenosine tetraphosphate (Ap4A) HIT family hydrolase